MNNNDKLYAMKRKSPFTAVILSLLFIGAGSMYSGKVLSGIVQIFISLVLWLFLMGWVMWFISPFLANIDAKNYNEILALELGVDGE